MTATPVRVSAITPTFNRARFLPDAIESVLAQEFDGVEHVIVDDGSTDETPAILARYRDRHGDRVRYHRQENAGGAAAWNRCLEMARGEYVALLDDDDLFLPGKLARQVPLLDARPAAALVYSPVEYIDAVGRPLPDERLPKRTPAGFVFRALLLENFVRSPAVLARRALLIGAGGFDVALTHAKDWDMLLRLAPEHEFLYDPVPTARVRHHGDQVITGRRRMAEARVRVLEKVVARAASGPPGDAAAARRALAGRCVKLARLDLREGREAEADRLFDRALELAPRLRPEVWRIRLAERLRARRG